jgi:hypothetical protein
MNVTLSAALGRIPTAMPPAEKSEKAAHDFESVLLTSLFDSLQKSFAFDSQDETPGASDYRMMGTQALAKAVADGGGIGIGRLILRHLRAPTVQMEAEREGRKS